MFFLDGLKNALQTYKLICKVLYGNLECNNHTKKKKKKQDQTTITQLNLNYNTYCHLNFTMKH